MFKASLKEGPSQKVQQITKEDGVHGVVVDKHLGERLEAEVWIGLVPGKKYSQCFDTSIRYIHKIS